jgi:hypothetical protein
MLEVGVKKIADKKFIKTIEMVLGDSKYALMQLF